MIKVARNKNVKIDSHADRRVVNPPKFVRPVNLYDYIFIPKNLTDFTTLTERQKTAIKNIEKYWINRNRNYKNWNIQKHWNYRKESISSRIEKQLYKQLENNNNNKSIQNFIRHFLRDAEFRNIFFNKLWEQFEKDPGIILVELKYLDYTDKKGFLIRLFPHVISGQIYNFEKVLFTFYSTFLTEFSTSYMIRIALMHFKNEKEQEPIEPNEVVDIMSELIKDGRRVIFD